ncbi:1-acyl-sn-glycerol-3-phosphate acyltransferase [Sanguibacter gelidistatuariae]|uniref:1-acyl-sn-glycerol-3-phosphate acyltransferase n=1 Tax=Sanguibacter gelidistatuariae TaxID=1814289 RepID=A0A1G6T4L5_9MICO|nr:lysophospholipid acyltransferase family protein [Sanguibacter gelidistatuariae]SDD24100.1 1-acyl-sn-glycerol-3-phosphate acyltransferase [Sanguibacter gelidistatuariae]
MRPDDSSAADGTPAPPPTPGAPGPRGPAWSRWVGRFLARVVWNTEVVGAEHVPTTGPVLLAANHTGIMDGPIILGVAPRPVHILIKESFFQGVLGVILRAAGQIPVDQDSPRSALTIAVAVLRRGGGVGIFPEGNRGRGDLAGVRAGVAWLALTSGAPVVPVAVLGTRRTGEKVGVIPGLRRRLVVEFGPPVVISRGPGTTGKAALAQGNEQVRQALRAVVASAVGRSGIPLPVDDPNRERPA